MTTSNSLGTVALKYPVQMGSETVSEVELKRPTGAAIRAMGNGKNQEDKMLILIAYASGLPAKTIDQMDIVDITALSELAGSALGESQATGATS